MPWAPKRPCGHIGCGALTDGSRCEAHRKQEAREYDKSRQQDPYRKIYSSRRWRAVRMAHLQAEPLCRSCKAEGRVAAATIVDHVKPMKQGGAPFDDANLQGLCSPCHSAKSIREGSRYGGAPSREDDEPKYVIA
jgi:5-methylcytosine-specific restriction enzyme A